MDLHARTLAFALVALASYGSGCAAHAQASGPTTDPMANVTGQQLYDTGLAAARAGDLVRAEQYLVASMQRGMPERTALRQLVSVCVQASRFRAAVSYARPYLERHPHDWALRYLLGTILEGLDEHQAARRELEAVIADNARHAEAHYLLAMLLRERFNDPVSADVHYRQYLEIEPQGTHAEEARQGMLRQVGP
ncbi:MAG: tetratricopeptide repeat protein [Polyangiales bacterium]